MKLILYQTADNQTVLNKTYMELATIELKLKSSFSYLSGGTITIDKDKFNDKSNYCKLGNYFYWIDNIVQLSNNHISLSLSFDLLENNIDVIKNSTLYVNKTDSLNYNYSNDTVDTSNKKDIVLSCDKTFTPATNIILVTLGG